MNSNIIYLDNAATSLPKPQSVVTAVENALQNLGSAGRGAHKLALDGARAVFETRTAVAEFLGASSERLIFTPGCTYSLNFVLKGIDLRAGDTVVVSALEHNAVMRPLRQLEHSINLNVISLPYTRGHIVSPADIEDLLSAVKPKLCAIVEGSNVTGEMMDLQSVARACMKQRVPLLVDAAQTAGRYRDILQLPGISFWAASAHKGFFAPAGVGLLYVNPNYDLEPIISGGTGSASESAEVPPHYPDRLEAGTLPISSIAGLRAGVDFLSQAGVEKIRAHESELCDKFVRWCTANPAIRMISFERELARLPIVAFEVDGVSPDRVADLLDTEYGIAVRSGLQCAAQAHATLGTTKRGVVRASFGYFNKAEDVDALCQAVASIVKHVAV
jgi:cysteine desulfurase family protein